MQKTLKCSKSQLNLTDYYDDKRTFLHLAANHGHDTILKHFLDNCSDDSTREKFWAKDDQGNTIIHYLVKKIHDFQQQNDGHGAQQPARDEFPMSNLKIDVESQSEPLLHTGGATRDSLDQNERNVSLGKYKACLSAILDNKNLKLPKFLAKKG